MTDRELTPSFGFALVLFLINILILSTGVFVLKVDAQPLLILNIVVTSIASIRYGFSWEFVERALVKGISRAVSSLFIFILIGMLIGSWTQAGTVPGLVYYGLGFISPKFLLPAGFLACTIMSFATGTCWGTGGTLGVALLGMGVSMGMPPALVAGMVISGSYFGDKMSPISDTNILSTSNSGSNIYGHITSRARTAIPTFLISLALYTFLGFTYASSSYNPTDVIAIQEEISQMFNISILTLLPLLILIAVSVAKVPALPSLAIGVGAGIVNAIFLQGANLSEVLSVLNYGFKAEATNKVVQTIVNNGGIQDMMWTFSLAFIAVAFGGLLEETKILKVLIMRFGNGIKTHFALVTSTIVTSILSNIVMGENYLSSIINSRLWIPVYDRLGLQRRMLSRVVEEGANLTSALIPWTTAGAFFYGAFNLSPVEYAPFAFSNYICFLLTIVLAFFGKGLVKVPKEGEYDRYYEAEEKLRID